MSAKKPTKINQLMTTQPSNVVFLSSWLVDNGYSGLLQTRYRKSGRLKSIGVGAMIKSGANIDYTGAVYALQKQKGKTIHPGDKTALSLLRKAHYPEFEPQEYYTSRR
ncbi:MAG: AbiEi antitoxin N-terminal domain-containing protein [Dysgonamonadaceae bacterium]